MTKDIIEGEWAGANPNVILVILFMIGFSLWIILTKEKWYVIGIETLSWLCLIWSIVFGKVKIRKEKQK